MLPHHRCKKDWFPDWMYVLNLFISNILIKYLRFEILLESNSAGVSPKIDWIKFLYNKMNYPGWENFDSTNSPLTSNQISSIAIGNQGELWISS